MLAVTEGIYDMSGMRRCIGCNKDCFNIAILHQLFQGWICYGTVTGFGKGSAPVREEVTYCHYLDIRMILESEVGSESADTVTNYPHADLSVGNRYPAFRSVCLRSSLKSLNWNRLC